MTYAATITQKGQVTIPVAIRNYFGLKPADKILFRIEQKKLVAEPIKSDLLSLYGSVKPRGKKPVDLKKVRQYVRKKIAEHIVAEMNS
jgi:AbrB family looped-hinge helix DNA binding protein